MKVKIVIMCVLFCLAVSSIFIVSEISPAGESIDGPCIITKPLGELISGIIYKDGRSMFSSGFLRYGLYYPGTHERSGKKCRRLINITEAGYNCRMYGLCPGIIK